MSYIVIRVYSFECDHLGCEETIECGGPSLRDALREFRWAPLGWTVRGTGRKRQTFCPEHGQEVMPRDRMATSDDQSLHPTRVTARSRVTLELGSA